MRHLTKEAQIMAAILVKKVAKPIDAFVDLRDDINCGV
jgi:hypothetical protein